MKGAGSSLQRGREPVGQCVKCSEVQKDLMNPPEPLTDWKQVSNWVLVFPLTKIYMCIRPHQRHRETNDRLHSRTNLWFRFQSTSPVKNLENQENPGDT